MDRALRIAGSMLLFAVCAACSKAPSEAVAPSDPSETAEMRQPVSQTRITSASLDNVDRSGAAALPIDSENASTPQDRDLVDQLRRAVVADDTITSKSKTVTIAVHGGVITLSGLVSNVREHDAILDKARVLAGAGRVVDEIEVASP